MDVSVNGMLRGCIDICVRDHHRKRDKTWHNLGMC